MTKVLANLSARERRLAALTVFVLTGAACVLSGMRAYEHVASLDGKIAQLEQELLNLTQQSAQRSSVEAAYLEVVEAHSSKMTKEEIHDNLRREIFSLARTTVPGKEGMTASPKTSNGSPISGKIAGRVSGTAAIFCSEKHSAPPTSCSRRW